MNAIVAVDKNWGIGKDNNLLFHISEDMKFFKERTTNNVVIMGRKTLESFPNRKPLKNRTNIILTTDVTYQVNNAIVVHSIQELMQELLKYTSDNIFVIGGGSIYTQLLQYCDTVYVTKVNSSKEADTFFPNLDTMDNWVLSYTSEEKSTETLKFNFCTYKKR